LNFNFLIQTREKRLVYGQAQFILIPSLLQLDTKKHRNLKVFFTFISPVLKIFLTFVIEK